MTLKRGLRDSKQFRNEFALWQKNFGVVVRRLRKKAGLSRPELANMAKFSVSTLETIEQGHGNPGLTRMMNLAHALKHTLSYLFGLTQELNDEEKH
ncbi:MAG: helix-turn-helix transcriptional regulator [Candidatus Sulfotelmatobacter sp.]|jgi:transcriptional regulator with XRE-family HTH domain